MKRTNPRKLTDARKKQFTLADFFSNKPRPTLPLNVTPSDVGEKSDGDQNQTTEARAVSSFTEDNNNDLSKIDAGVLKFSQSGKRKFQQSWLDVLLWLRYDEGIAKCEVCNNFPNIADSSSKVVTGYSGPFKLETFKKHEKSYTHIKCEEANTTKKNPESSPLAKCVKKKKWMLICCNI